MLEQIKDHTDDVLISVWNHHDGSHDIFNGTEEIKQYFKNLYPTFNDVSDMNAFVWDVDECAAGMPGLVFLVWRSPNSGYPSAADTFVFDSNFKIQRQFMAEVHKGGDPFAACLDGKSGFEIYHPDAVVRVFNQTDMSMAVFRGDDIKNLLQWLKPGQATFRNRTLFPSTEKAPATRSLSPPLPPPSPPTHPTCLPCLPCLPNPASAHGTLRAWG